LCTRGYSTISTIHALWGAKKKNPIPVYSYCKQNMNSTKVSQVRERGATIVETGASLAVFLPILLAMLFVVIEVSTAFLIKESLAQGAREAARALAVAYGNNPGIATSRSQQNAQVFDTIRIVNIIASSAQFSNPVFSPNANPPTVTVTATFTSNQNGLPQFPNPDPLHLGANFKLSSTSTYRLE
jgi:hypothetical protein